MKFTSIIALFSMLAGHTSMSENRSVHLHVSDNNDQITVEVIGETKRTQHVDFTIEVTGSSQSRHSGSLTLVENSPQVLSTLKMSAQENWCAKLKVKEEGQDTYEASEGPCRS